MIRSQTWLSRALALGVTSALIAACGGTTPSTSPATTQGPGQTGTATAAPTTASGPQKGGTIYLLSDADNWVDVDPQRVYTGEDASFFGSTIYRGLVTYVSSPDLVEGTKIEGDLATDVGTPSDGGKTWSFTLRDGVSWQDGSPLTCADVAYGVSRQYATDIMGGGPTYGIQFLDVPFKADGSSEYPGPYKATAEQQALFDKAVVCDGDKKITFHLNSARGDFAESTLWGSFPVPNPKGHPGMPDIGEGYGITTPPWASGPYKVESYTQGKGGSMVLVRNENWKQESDPVHLALPDKWVVSFGNDTQLIDQRLMNPSGEDEFAIPYGGLLPTNKPTVFKDAETPNPDYASRAVGGLDVYVRYWWMDVNKIPNVKIRQAISVALDREAVRTVLGGDFYGDYANGTIKPNIGIDYADTGFYTDLFGEAIPPTGNPELAKKLILESGEPAPTLTWNYADRAPAPEYFAVVQSSLARAGITVNPGAIPPGDYYKVVFDPKNELTGEFGNTGWGPDWPNAYTVINPLFTDVGGWNLSKVHDATFEAAIKDAAATLDRAAQAAKWQALNKQATEQGWIVPTFFGKAQYVAGSKVGPIYRWPGASSWPYSVMGVLP
jgi:peptide/nickel transport system substrate-binding protein